MSARRADSRPAVAICLFVLGCSGGGEPIPRRARTNAAEESAAHVTQVDLCAASDTPDVSRDSIGHLRLATPLGQLRARCASARDTIHEGEDVAHAAVAFPLRELMVVGWQFREALEPTLAADAWVVAGSRARLPEGIALTTSWDQISRAYGRAVGHDDFGVMVMFCRLPYLFFKFDVDPDRVGPIWDGDFSQFPDSARIVEVSVLSQGAWRCR